MGGLFFFLLSLSLSLSFSFFSLFSLFVFHLYFILQKVKRDGKKNLSFSLSSLLSLLSLSLSLSLFLSFLTPFLQGAEFETKGIEDLYESWKGEEGGKKKIVYLSPDADEILPSVQEGVYYCVGGLVDKQRKKVFLFLFILFICLFVYLFVYLFVCLFGWVFVACCLLLHNIYIYVLRTIIKITTIHLLLILKR